MCQKPILIVIYMKQSVTSWRVGLITFVLFIICNFLTVVLSANVLVVTLVDITMDTYLHIVIGKRKSPYRSLRQCCDKVT